MMWGVGKTDRLLISIIMAQSRCVHDDIVYYAHCCVPSCSNLVSSLELMDTLIRCLFSPSHQQSGFESC